MLFEGYLTICNSCHTKGHFESRCHKGGVKVELVNVQAAKKGMEYLVLRRKDLLSLSTTVGLECANKEDANVLSFVGKVVAENDSGNNITV